MKAFILLTAPAIVITIIAFLLPPIPQPLAYHNFADQRGWLGIPNFADVFSNLPFAIVGQWGLVLLLAPRKIRFVDARERWLYLVTFAALILTAWARPITTSHPTMPAWSGIASRSISFSWRCWRR
jgi:hypothetical protein